MIKQFVCRIGELDYCYNSIELILHYLYKIILQS